MHSGPQFQLHPTRIDLGPFTKQLMWLGYIGQNGHVRNSQRDRNRESLHLHDGGFSKRQTSLVRQRRDALCAHHFIDLALDLV
ncbi:hypothetical protein EYF80_000003 [Liparis tanakae]|uniref:Uncharacterized protein n=1 Tax=Liparis tanakae TaxID=230148 RepID=A0A4Z2JGW7_9TELE|nr:hypothetical protein EYF80_000003 [Liparis tanakae]